MEHAPSAERYEGRIESIAGLTVHPDLASQIKAIRKNGYFYENLRQKFSE